MRMLTESSDLQAFLTAFQCLFDYVSCIVSNNPEVIQITVNSLVVIWDIRKIARESNIKISMLDDEDDNGYQQ